MRLKDYISYLLLAAVGVLIFTLTDYIQWYGDSYLYRFDFATGEPIKSFWEIFPSQYAHYFMMNGRVWAHVLCQAFSALWGQTAFAVCNALVYVAFVLLFVKIVGGKWRNIPTLLSCILVILFFCDTSYNANCQIGYIWTSAITLAFIILFFKERSTKREPNWVLLSLLFLLSLLAGNGNEAIAIGVGAALIFDFFSNFKKLTAAQWVMFTGFGIGGLILCLSPGILDRSSGESANFIYSTYRLLIHSRALYLFALTIAILKIRKKIRLKAFISENRFFFVAFATLILFNYLIGIGIANRQLFGVELFSAILTLKALNKQAFPKWTLTILWIMVTGIYALKFEYLHDSNEDLRALRKEIENSLDGVIYLDFKKYNSLVRPTEVYDMQIPSDFTAYSIYDEIHNKGHLYQLRNSIDITPYPIEYRIYPTAFKDVLRREDRNFVMKCADGTYFLVQDRMNPATFILHRQFNIFGLKYPLHPYTVEFKDDYSLNNDGTRVLFEKFGVPLVENGDIEIIRCK